jgi:hypothetical protein
MPGKQLLNNVFQTGKAAGLVTRTGLQYYPTTAIGFPKRGAALLILLLVAGCCNALLRFYVSPKGDDNNAGSPGTTADALYKWPIRK